MWIESNANKQAFIYLHTFLRSDDTTISRWLMMVNKIMFNTGIIFIVIAAILMIGNFLGDSTFPIMLGILGIISIGASKYRPLKATQSAKWKKSIMISEISSTWTGIRQKKGRFAGVVEMYPMVIGLTELYCWGNV